VTAQTQEPAHGQRLWFACKSLVSLLVAGLLVWQIIDGVGDTGNVRRARDKGNAGRSRDARSDRNVPADPAWEESGAARLIVCQSLDSSGRTKGVAEAERLEVVLRDGTTLTLPPHYDQPLEQLHAWLAA